MRPAISLIVPVRDRCALTVRCLTRIAQLPSSPSFEVVLVDDGSTDQTAQILAGLEGDVHVLSNPDPVGFAAACDQAAELARGERLVFVHQDAIPCAGWLHDLDEALGGDPDCVAVLPRSVDRQGNTLPESQWLSLAVRRDAYRAVGGFAGTARPARPEKGSLLESLRGAGWTVATALTALLLLAP